MPILNIAAPPLNSLRRLMLQSGRKGFPTIFVRENPTFANRLQLSPDSFDYGLYRPVESFLARSFCKAIKGVSVTIHRGNGRIVENFTSIGKMREDATWR